MPRASYTPRVDSIPTAQLKPWVLRALEQFPDAALTSAEILRIVDAQLRERNPDEWRFANAQSVKNAAVALMDEGRVYRRVIDIGDGPLFEKRGRFQTGYVYSLKNPVPVWSLAISQTIKSKFPKPRSQPVPSTATPRPKAPRGPSDDEKVELIVTLIRNLAADQSGGSEIERLSAALAERTAERDEALKQLRQIAKARAALDKLLGGTNAGQT